MVPAQRIYVVIKFVTQLVHENERAKTIILNSEIFSAKYKDAVDWLQEELQKNSQSTNSNGTFLRVHILGLANIL